jgi:hypothetical protein
VDPNLWPTGLLRGEQVVDSEFRLSRGWGPLQRSRDGQSPKVLLVRLENREPGVEPVDQFAVTEY